MTSTTVHFELKASYITYRIIRPSSILTAVFVYALEILVKTLGNDNFDSIPKTALTTMCMFRGQKKQKTRICHISLKLLCIKDHV